MRLNDTGWKFHPELPADILICGGTHEPLVTIKPDGTVVIHKEGADRDAAVGFYRCLEIEGKTLHARIAELERENRRLADLLHKR